MKKLLTVILSFTAIIAGAQNFKSLNFLNVQSMSVSNTANYTNIASYFGQPGTATTNANLFTYTNIDGTYVIDYTSNTNTGITVQSNGVVNYTNDMTFLTKDILFHSDLVGNICTNFNISLAAIGNGTVTGAVLCVFAPIVKGGLVPQGPNVGIIPPILGSGGVVTVLDITNAFTLAFTTKLSGAFSTAQPIPPNVLQGYKGCRLLTCSVTNTAGQVNILDISCNTFIP